MQDLQVSRHYSRQGEPTVLYDLRVVWISYVFFCDHKLCAHVISRTIRVCDQDWFPGANWKEDQGGIRQRLEKGLDVLYVYYAFRRGLLCFECALCVLWMCFQCCALCVVVLSEWRSAILSP